MRLRPVIATPLAFHASPCGPLRPNVTSSIKPEVHNVSQRRCRRTELPTATGDLHREFREDRLSGSRDMLANRQIDAQTDTQTDKLIAILRSPNGAE